jgi:hypothetical protein
LCDLRVGDPIGYSFCMAFRCRTAFPASAHLDCNGDHLRLLHGGSLWPLQSMLTWICGVGPQVAIEMLRSGEVEAVVCVQSDPDDRSVVGIALVHQLDLVVHCACTVLC